MKKIILAVLMSAAVITAAAGEREELLEIFARENKAADDIFQNAMTTIDLNGAAGNLKNVARKQWLRALDYKLRHTANAGERLQLLENFHNVSREIEKLLATPRENMGSLAAMWIYNSAADMMFQEIAILMLDAGSEQRWRRISGAELIIDGKKVKLERGKARFTAVISEKETELKVFLLPENTFSYQNRDFAVIRTDIRFAGNDDFSSVYVCELDNGTLRIRTKSRLTGFSNWSLKDGTLTISNDKESENILLK